VFSSVDPVSDRAPRRGRRASHFVPPVRLPTTPSTIRSGVRPPLWAQRPRRALFVAPGLRPDGMLPARGEPCFRVVLRKNASRMFFLPSLQAPPPHNGPPPPAIGTWGGRLLEESDQPPHKNPPNLRLPTHPHSAAAHCGPHAPPNGSPVPPWPPRCLLLSSSFGLNLWGGGASCLPGAGAGPSAQTRCPGKSLVSAFGTGDAAAPGRHFLGGHTKTAALRFGAAPALHCSRRGKVRWPHGPSPLICSLLLRATHAQNGFPAMVGTQVEQSLL